MRELAYPQLLILVVAVAAVAAPASPPQGYVARGTFRAILRGMLYQSPRTNLLHRLFALGIWVKGIDGALEILGGATLLLTSNAALNQLVIMLTQHELSEDPHDWIATAIRHTAAQLSASTRVFGSVYLLVHGLAKVVLVVGLLRGQRWAYPGGIGFLGLFLVYQLYRLSYHFSIGLLLLTLFDLVIVALIWHEYHALMAAPRLEHE